MKTPKTYQLRGCVNLQESKSLGLEKTPRLSKTFALRGAIVSPTQEVRAIKTAEKRPPKKDEWYISGSKPEAYRAPHDLKASYWIAKLCLVEKVTEYRIVKKV